MDSDIVSTIPDNSYDYTSRSVLSAPAVSVVTALLFSYFPPLSAKQDMAIG